MKDMRSRQIVVLEDRHMGDELVRGYMQEGYGIIQIPDLSSLAKSSSDYLLTVIADEIHEFIKDGQQVVVLEGKKDPWVRSLLSRLSKRQLNVKVSEIS
jgi:hypothetical protein